MNDKKMKTSTKVLIGLALIVTGLFFVGVEFGFALLIMGSGIFMIVFSIVNPIASYEEYGSRRRTVYITCFVIFAIIFVIGLMLFFDSHGGIGGALLGLLFGGIGGLGFASTIITIVITEISIKYSRSPQDQAGQHKGDDKNGPKNPKTGAESR